MNLHDPARPHILHKQAFTSGWHVIPKLQIWPLENEWVEISLMLPIPDQRFAGKWYTLKITREKVPILIEQFEHDPEAFVLTYFNLDIEKLTRTPPFGRKAAREPVRGSIRESTSASAELLSVEETLAGEEEL